MFSFFKSDKKRKNKLKDLISKEVKDTESSYIANVDESFSEESTSIISQLKKTHFSFIEFIENTKTSLSPNTIFVIEVLDNHVTVGIISKKGVFLDIQYLKKYTFEQLHHSYQSIINKKVEFDRQWYESLENIITIVSYETIYTLPEKVIIIDNRYSEFVNVITKKSRFTDKNAINNIIKKEMELASGYKDADVYKQITLRPTDEKLDKNIYVVSMVEKEYFEKIDNYFNVSGFSLKKFHSIKSSLYSSFFTQEKDSKMRIHILGNIAYCMQKYKDSGFEYQQFDLELDSNGIELVAYAMDEVIISGEGEYFSKIKKSFVASKIKVRTFNYIKDLNRCIIRLEKGVSLDSSYASIINIAYHELFKINFSSIRLGVSKKMTMYEILYNNLNIIPFLIVLGVFIVCYGAHLYLKYQYEELQNGHKNTTNLIKKEKQLKKDIQRYNGNISNIQAKVTKTSNILLNKNESIDAIILHEIAQKLPNDMILTKIEKMTKYSDKRKQKIGMESIKVTGKCYHELSLLKYIKNLKIEGKKVFLISLNDSRITKFKDKKEDKTVYNDLKTAKNETKANKQNSVEENFNNLEKEIKKLNLENKKVYFSDTLNNTFVLEVK